MCCTPFRGVDACSENNGNFLISRVRRVLLSNFFFIMLVYMHLKYDKIFSCIHYLLCLWQLIRLNVFHLLKEMDQRICIKGRSRISMVWVPPLGFDPYCKGKWLPLQDELTSSINSKKKIFQSYKRILKNQKIKFSRKRLYRS